jgi:hypothetical protein
MKAGSDTTIGSGASVYRYYDKLGILIYVGITSQRSTRQQQHNSDKAWWPHVAKQEVDHFLTRADALARERSLIQTFLPPFNTQHNRDHIEMRRAYELLALANIESDPRVVWKTTNGHLPLTCVSRNEVLQLATFRSRIEHAALAFSLKYTAQIRVMRQGTGIAQVYQFLRVGPILEIRARDMRRGVSFESVDGKLKQLPVKGPFVTELRQIVVV